MHVMLATLLEILQSSVVFLAIVVRIHTEQVRVVHGAVVWSAILSNVLRYAAEPQIAPFERLVARSVCRGARIDTGRSGTSVVRCASQYTTSIATFRENWPVLLDVGEILPMLRYIRIRFHTYVAQEVLQVGCVHETLIYSVR